MFIPLNVLLSSVPPHMKSEIRRNVQSLGGKVFGDWMEACNLLVMPKYFPPIEEKGFTDVDAPKFFANPDRRFVFTNKTFIFLTESKFNRYSLLLSLTNAQTKCIANTAPLSRRELSDLFKSVSDPCLLYEAKTSTPSQQLAELVLKEELDRRPIFDQEITLAIIESSCEIYCNATRRCPSSNDGTFSSLPISIAPSDRAASFSVTNRRCSLLKRPR
uniref:NIBRIN_BRCT_II domain-containing protein n=1 Tax=Mesocestoides corti TaxID=53468 RepID=A0A5K3FP92_MESCO